MLLPGGGLLAAVLLAWAAYRVRRNRKADPADPLAATDDAPVPTPPIMPETEEPVAAAPVVPEPAAEPEPEPETIAAAPEDVLTPPAEEPAIETPPVADPLFASDETAAVAAAQAEAAEQQAKRDAEEALKIDLSRMEPAPSTPPAAAPALDMSNLGFDLELDPNVKAPAEDSPLEIDLAAELAAQQDAKPYEAPPSTVSDSVTPAFDQPAVLPPAIEGLSLDLNDAEPEPAAAPAETGAGPAEAAAEDGAAKEGEEEEDETSSFAKEINTKLDLAAAYQEIGDKDGARELLEEVVQSGNKRQVAKAQEMLGQLA
jgi:pilus assembly protein FimV